MQELIQFLLELLQAGWAFTVAGLTFVITQGHLIATFCALAITALLVNHYRSRLASGTSRSAGVATSSARWAGRNAMSGGRWVGRSLASTIRWIKNQINPPPAPATDEEKQSHVVKVNAWLYFLVLFVFYVAFPLYFWYLTGQAGDSAEVGWIGLVLVGLHLVASVKLLRADQIAAIDFLNIPVLETAFQLLIVPQGFSSIKRMPRGNVQKDIPAPPEKIFRKGDKEFGEAERKADLSLPMRILTGPMSNLPEDKDSPLNIQMALEMEVTVRARISRPWGFLVNLGGDFNEFWRQVQDTIQNGLTRQFAQHSTAGVIRKLDDIREDVEEELDLKISPWGFDLLALEVKSPDVTHTLSSSLRDVGNARALAEGVRQAAAAEATAINVKGAATANAEAALILRQGEATAAAAKVMGIDALDVQDAETARDVLKGDNKWVLGTPGLLASLAGMFSGTRKSDEDTAASRRRRRRSTEAPT